MRALMSDAQSGLLRALFAMVEKTMPDVRHCPEAMVVEAHQAEPWASITFSGQRHHIALRLGGGRDQQRRLAHILESHVSQMAWSAAGHYLVDAMVSSLREEADADVPVTRIEIEAVTLDED